MDQPLSEVKFQVPSFVMLVSEESSSWPFWLTMAQLVVQARALHVDVAESVSAGTDVIRISVIDHASADINPGEAVVCSVEAEVGIITAWVVVRDDDRAAIDHIDVDIG